MNVAIYGIYGQMGQMVLELAKKEKQIDKIFGVDVQTGSLDVPVVDNLQKIFEKIDVIIDFSSPKALDGILDFAIQNKVAVVLATTGFTKQQLIQIQHAAKKIAIFQTANFSIGISLLQFLVEKAASFLGNNFDIEIIEKHHKYKKDAPSGTAFMLAESAKKGLATNTNFTFGRSGTNLIRTNHEIGIHAVRGGNIVGEHNVLFAGNYESISLCHTANSKTLFASGALQAALFINTKPCGYYTMQDILNDIFK